MRVLFYLFFVLFFMKKGVNNRVGIYWRIHDLANKWGRVLMVHVSYKIHHVSYTCCTWKANLRGQFYHLLYKSIIQISTNSQHNSSIQFYFEHSSQPTFLTLILIEYLVNFKMGYIFRQIIYSLHTLKFIANGFWQSNFVNVWWCIFCKYMKCNFWIVIIRINKFWLKQCDIAII